MSTRISVFGSIMSGLFLATSTVSWAQTGDAKLPLSFQRLGNDQAIRFSVSADRTSFSVAPVVFEVEVINQPQLQVKIWMSINASMSVPEAEKAWGHQVMEPIMRALQPTDLRVLDNFLKAHRAKGALIHPSSAGGGVFQLVTYRTAKDGTQRADVTNTEYYNPLPDATREDFIKRFVGFSRK